MAVMLCQNRPEGLSTTSQITPGLPTQCFFDTVLVPLPTWVYLTSLVMMGVFRSRTPSAAMARPEKQIVNRRWVRFLTPSVYYFFVFVILLMESVEVARFVQAGLGVGLTPFVFGGCVVAVILPATDVSLARMLGISTGWWQEATALFWVLSGIITALKVTAVGRMAVLRGGKFAREDSAYPAVHQWTDLLILVIFYFLLVVALVVMQYFKPGYETPKSKEPINGEGIEFKG